MSPQRLIALILFCLLAGCTPTSPPDNPSLHVKVIPIHIHFENLRFTFVSLQSGNQITASVACDLSIHMTSEGTWNIATSVFPMDVRTNSLGLLFLSHAAWQYLNGGPPTPGVSIKSADLPDSGPWWFAGDQKMEYGSTTLAIRDGKTMIQVTSDDPGGETKWLPLDNNSFGLWWKQVNEKLNLDAMFTPPDP